MKTIALTGIDLQVMKYYQKGSELCGFEGVHTNLCNNGYLDSDLELTIKGREFLKENAELLELIEPYKNTTYISIR